MRIVQIAPCFLPVRGDLEYGGTEREIFYLDREFARLGHDSSVVGTSDSFPHGRLLPTVPSIGVSDVYSSAISAKDHRDNTYAKLSHLAQAIDHTRHGNGIVHVHDDYLLPFLPLLGRSLLTVHSPPEDFWPAGYREMSRTAHLVAISRAQQKALAERGFVAKEVVYNAVPVEEYEYREEKGGFLFSLGAIRPEKGQHTAVAVAQRLGMDLVIAGPVADESFFSSHIKPHVTHSLEQEGNKLEAYNSLEGGRKIVYAGAVNDEQKKPLYSSARAFLMPIDWEEPFGLVMVEALASGTPVVAFHRGSVPEIISHGKTGFVVRDAEEMAEAVREIEKIRPGDCRREAGKRFSPSVAAEKYLRLYAGIGR